MSAVPDDVAAILAAIKHPIRLPILVALEKRPRTAAELVADLGLESDPVHWALKKLRAAGFVEIIDHDVTTNNLKVATYATTKRKWNGVLKALAVVAASNPE